MVTTALLTHKTTVETVIYFYKTKNTALTYFLLLKQNIIKQHLSLTLINKHCQLLIYSSG